MKRTNNTVALLFCMAACAAAPLACAAAPAQPDTPAAAPAQPDTAAARPARGPEDKEQLARRLASVAKLIESSSAAKQIDSSATPEAVAARTSARTMHEQATQAFQAGNYARASELLDQAAKAMFGAVRQAAPEQIGRAKLQRDFDNRMESVTALLAAQKRINAEKKGGTETDATLEAQRKSAAAMAAEGKLEQARVLLDQVYLRTKLAIENMRRGDTLVRSLNFATKEEEYRYEVDRNDTHTMLIKMLLEEKRNANASVDTMVQKFLDQAVRLRGEAEAQAARKDYVAGIKLLEDSTRELVRAIRGAGVYIPG